MKSPSHEIAMRFTKPEWRQIRRAAQKRKIQPARYVIESALCMSTDDLRPAPRSTQPWEEEKPWEEETP